MTDARLDNEGLWSDRKTAITVSSGERIDPLHAAVAEITVYDIAHSLARLCRYNGHVGYFLSVARHSILVAGRLAHLYPFEPELAFHGLLHDAAEAYLGDMVRPLKHGPTIGEAYLEAEANLEEVIAQRFGLCWPAPPSIHQADNYVLLELELSGPTYRWTYKGDPATDEAAWLDKYRTLQAEMRAK